MDLQNILVENRFAPLIIRGHALLPIVQGGMGVGISAHRLAGSVARLGALGTIASVDLRRHHADLMRETAHCRDRSTIDRANLVALDREIVAARAIADGRGMLAVNVMRAVSGYADYVQQACASGIDAVVVGAGLPLDLPDLTADFPDIALIPILSDARGIQLIVKKWARKHRLPDAIIIEHPRYAGGHLGAAFAVTEEGDAAPEFKAVLANARPEDLVEFMSVAGLPARAVRTPWLENYLRHLPKMQALARKKRRCTLHFDCLIQCGLRDGIAHIGQFCIDTQLAAALRGDVKKGLFFRGAATLPFGSEIRPVSDLVEYLLGTSSGARAQLA